MRANSDHIREVTWATLDDMTSDLVVLTRVLERTAGNGTEVSIGGAVYLLSNVGTLPRNAGEAMYLVMNAKEVGKRIYFLGARETSGEMWEKLRADPSRFLTVQALS